MSTMLLGLKQVASSLLTLVSAKKGWGDGDHMTNPGTFSAFGAGGSLNTLLGDMVIEPLITVDASLKGNKKLDKVVKYQLGLFTSFYARGLQKLISINGMHPSTALRLLGNRRSSMAGDLHRLLTGERLNDDAEFLPIANIENIDNTGESRGKKHRGSRNRSSSSNHSSKSKLSKVEVSGDTYRQEFELEFTIPNENGSGVRDIAIPIIVIPRVEFVNKNDINTLLEGKSKLEDSFYTVYHEKLSRGGSVWDAILSNDLIKRDKKKMINDTSGLMEEINDRREEANKMLATDGAIGFGKYYQMFIVSESTLKMLEKTLRSKISKNASEFLDATYSMAFSSMDDDFEMVTTHIRGMRGRIEQSYKTLSKDKKSESLDDILKIMATRM